MPSSLVRPSSADSSVPPASVGQTSARPTFVWFQLCLRVAFVAALILLLSGWTCSAFISFESCQNDAARTEIASLSPGSIASGAGPVLLTVEGSGFTPQATLLWNGSALETTFVDAHHLQTTITQETFDAFGGSAGSTVLISVRPQGSGSPGSGCPSARDSAAKALVIE